MFAVLRRKTMYIMSFHVADIRSTYTVCNILYFMSCHCQNTEIDIGIDELYFCQL